jgi:hypothetical protein
MSKNNSKKDENVFKEEELNPVLHENHKLPTSRRDFLAHGFIGLMTTTALPTFSTLLLRSNSSYAQSVLECIPPSYTLGLPYICVDAAGGMNIAGQNVIVGMKNSDIQEDVGTDTSDYIRLGITPAEHPKDEAKVESKYKLKFHRASGILDGMNTVLDGQLVGGNPISNCIDGLVFCTRTGDDTATNPINTVYQANRAGAGGKIVQLVGNSNTDTGARSSAPTSLIDLKIRPTRITRNEDAAGLLTLGTDLMSNTYLDKANTGAKLEKFMSRIARMNKRKLDQIKSLDAATQIKEVLQCSTANAKQLFTTFSSEALNPANDQLVTDVYAGASENEAALAKMVIDQYAGAGTITIGGADYHGSMPAGSHAKDMQVGRAIGRAILLASKKSQNLAIHLYTDGGVAGDSGGVSAGVQTTNSGIIEKVRWTGDSGTRSSAVLLFYVHNHDGSEMVVDDGNGNGRRQVGNFKKAGGVNLDTVIGDSTENLWKAIMLNYLAVQDKVSQFETIFGAGSLPPEWQTLVRMKPVIKA